MSENCSICFEDVLLDSAIDIVSCDKHQFHAECLFLWHQNMHTEIHLWEVCIICQENLQQNEVDKAISYQAIFHKHIIENASLNNVAALKAQLESIDDVTYKFYKSLVTTALDFGSKEVLKYLKTLESKYISDQLRMERFTVEVFAAHKDSCLAWITGKYDTHSKSFQILDFILVEQLVNTGFYLQLFWIYTVQFSLLDDILRVSIAQTLYEGLQKGSWILAPYSSYPDQHCVIFTNLCEANPNLSCHILGFLCPFVIMTSTHSWETFEKTKFDHTLRCMQCGHSHYLDSLKMAIKNDNMSFLVAVSSTLGYYRFGEQEQHDLAVCILNYSSLPLHSAHVIEVAAGIFQRAMWNHIFHWNQHKMLLYGPDAVLTRCQARKIDKMTQKKYPRISRSNRYLHIYRSDFSFSFIKK